MTTIDPMTELERAKFDRDYANDVAGSVIAENKVLSERIRELEVQVERLVAARINELDLDEYDELQSTETEVVCSTK